MRSTLERGFRVRLGDKHRATAHFHGRASGYARMVERGFLRYLRRRERQAMLEYARLDDTGAHTVLDVGCGAGFYALAAKRQGKWVHAVDLAPNMVECVRRHVDLAEVADVEQLELRRAYDVVLCGGVLEFVIDPARAFENLCRLVAPGGRLVLQVPRVGWMSLLYRLEKGLCGISVNTFHYQWFAERALRAGLRLLAVCNPLPMNMVVLFGRELPLPQEGRDEPRPTGRASPECSPARS